MTTSLLHRLTFISVLTAGYSVCGDAYGRFLLEDADLIDQEERLSTETYNDKLSYRYPIAWDLIWAEKDAGFRANAGSLNVNRFNYLEEIKFIYSPADPVSFSFHRERDEDVVEERSEQEIRISWNVFEGIHVSLLGDGGGKKEYGDLGLAVGYEAQRDQKIEFFYWSVDHFYQTKKVESSDNRDKETYSIGWRGQWRFTEILELNLDYEYDKPLAWDRSSRGYYYKYWRRSATFGATVGNPEKVAGYVSAHQHRKEESKTYYLIADLEHSKGMNRLVEEYELGVKQNSGDLMVQSGVVLIQREATQTFSADTNVTEAMYVEEPGAPDSQRREQAFFANMYMQDASIGSQYGIYVNRVEIDEDGSEFRETEIKLQTAWDFLITKEARILANLTWDIDQLKKDYPYSDRGFKPWGGGNIQFIAAF